jgi:hypothetical protein
MRLAPRRGLALGGALAVTLGGSPAGGLALARAVAQGWEAVSGAWWWWPASRAILDLNFLGRDPTVITEFPAFSLLLGDLHPHYMALPLLACGAALLPEIARRARARAGGAPGGLLGGRAWGCAVALLLGAAGFLNSWDWPTLLGLAVLTYGVFRWRAGTPWLGDTLLVGLWLGTLGLAGYAPFYLDLDSQIEGVNLAYHAKTELPAYAQALGLWLWPLLAGLALDWRRLWARRRAVLARWALPCALGAAPPLGRAGAGPAWPGRPHRRRAMGHAAAERHVGGVVDPVGGGARGRHLLHAPRLGPHHGPGRRGPHLSHRVRLRGGPVQHADEHHLKVYTRPGGMLGLGHPGGAPPWWPQHAGAAGPAAVAAALG